jgi:hypothetical protein
VAIADFKQACVVLLNFALPWSKTKMLSLAGIWSERFFLRNFIHPRTVPPVSISASWSFIICVSKFLSNSGLRGPARTGA